MRRRNPLLAKPPRSFHNIRDEQRVKKWGYADPALGVHTVNDPLIAAAYAYSAWVTDDTAYPVVVTLNVKGLIAEPDVDAVVWWYEKGGREVAREAIEVAADGGVPESMYEGDGEYRESRQVSDVIWRRVDEGMNWDAVWWYADNGTMARAVKGDREAVDKILVDGFPQRRFMTDFDLDRVVEIDSFVPWFDDVVPYDLEEALFEGVESDCWRDSARLAEFVEARERGLVLVTLDELDHLEPTWIPLYQGKRQTRDIEYHGMNSDGLMAAFPTLKLPKRISFTEPKQNPGSAPARVIAYHASPKKDLHRLDWTKTRRMPGYLGPGIYLSPVRSFVERYHIPRETRLYTALVDTSGLVPARGYEVMKLPELAPLLADYEREYGVRPRWSNATALQDLSIAEPDTFVDIMRAHGITGTRGVDGGSLEEGFETFAVFDPDAVEIIE